ncbi:hypothetical protein J4711_13845 [Staphylococcus epidermidis]|nr:hypothetical protein [Staphylococcus epidermidis]
MEAASAQTVGTAMQEHPEIELVLLDLAMPGARGFSSLLHLRGEYAQVPSSSFRPMTTRDHPPRPAVRRGRFYLQVRCGGGYERCH